jgi:hypothetical protein
MMSNVHQAEIWNCKLKIPPTENYTIMYKRRFIVHVRYHAFQNPSVFHQPSINLYAHKLSHTVQQSIKCFTQGKTKNSNKKICQL